MTSTTSVVRSQYLPACDLDRPALTDRELGRMAFRIRLFQSRSWDEQRAEAWADRLQDRDAAKDPRHICMECTHLRTWMAADRETGAEVRDWKCQAKGTLLADVLQRCPKFTWETPKQ
jgi:hypothetical protein